MSILKGIFTSADCSEEVKPDLGFEVIFKEFYNRLVYFSLQLIKDKDLAKDIVQDAFVKYWNQQEAVTPDKTAIKNFLYSTVRNASLNTLRHAKVVDDYVQLNNLTEPEEAPVIEAIITAETVAELHAALQTLPENYRAISVLGYMDGKKNHEIADELEMSVNTVKKQKQRALQLLRMNLAPEMLMVLISLAFTRFL